MREEKLEPEIRVEDKKEEKELDKHQRPNIEKGNKGGGKTQGKPCKP